MVHLIYELNEFYVVQTHIQWYIFYQTDVEHKAGIQSEKIKTRSDILSHMRI